MANDDDDAINTCSTNNPQPTRRQALCQSANTIFSITLATTASPPPSSAVDLPNNPLRPQYAQSTGGQYKQAKRCTAYLVDATIPPSLIPYRAQREAAILKNLGMGRGTSKTPFIEEGVNLNNFMNKAVFGTYNALKDVVGLNDEGEGGQKKGGDNYQSFVFLGANFDGDSPTAAGDAGADAALAVSLMNDICKPRERDGNTAVALAFAPQSSQDDLNAFLSSDGSNDALAMLMKALVQSGANESLAASHIPIMQFARKKKYPLLALAPNPSDLETIRKGGLQSLDGDRRETYVADAQGFIALTQEPKFKLYTDKSLLKDFQPSTTKGGDENAVRAEQGNFFAERILVHEAGATAIAKWATKRPDSLVIAIAPIADVRFMGGLNGRVPRVCQFLNGRSEVDEEAVTTILLNPSAKVRCWNLLRIVACDDILRCMFH